MRTVIFIMAIMHFVVCFGQTRVLKTEKNGFQWYLLKDGYRRGAQSLDGTTIIPLSRDYNCVYFHPEEGYIGYFSFQEGSGPMNFAPSAESGYCDYTGKVIISPTDKLTFYSKKRGFMYKAGEDNYIAYGIKLDSNGRAYSTSDNSGSNSSSSQRNTSSGNITGNKKLVTTKICYGCNGSKVCQACYGRGGRNVGYGADAVWYNCSVCGGRAVCSKCQGKGELRIITTFDANGNAIATYEESTGQIIYGDGGGTSSLSNTNTYSQDERMCRACDGTGWIKRPIAAIRTYGEECPRCHEWMAAGTTGHIHQTCSVCKGRGKHK